MKIKEGKSELVKNVEIVKLTSEDWAKYKSIRLRALKEEPTAFGTSYEEALRRSDDHWKESLAKDDNKNTWHLFASYNGEIVGTANARCESGDKIGHLATIFGVYVAPEARNGGVALSLMKALIKEIESNQRITKIKLTVSSTQDPARRLYERLGFKQVGLLQKELLVNGEYIDEYQMEKFIR